MGIVESMNKNLGGEKKEKMKTKNKLLIMVEIAIVLCSVFLVALPAIAAEQNQEMQKVSASTITTASEDDYVLGIYGNANEDDTIDMRDLTYVKLIFFGKKPETELADAKYDGKINPLDFIQIKLIIVGKEKELTVVDYADRTVTIRKPIERIVVLNSDAAEALKVCGAADKVVGVSDSVCKKSYYFPELSKKASIGKYNKPDYEAIVALAPDIVISYGKPPHIFEVEEKLKPANIPVIGCYFYVQTNLRSEMKKMGYILDKEEEVKKYNDWCKKHEDSIKNFVAELKEEEKPRVLLLIHKQPVPNEIATLGPGSWLHDLCVRAGGINIAGNLDILYPKVPWEWVLEESQSKGIDVIIQYSRHGWGWDNIIEPEKLINQIISRPGAESIAAVKKNRVYVCSAEINSGVDSIVGLAYWAKCFHSELDIDPEGIYKEYLERFMDVEYPEDLIFVYPPLAS